MELLATSPLCGVIDLELAVPAPSFRESEHADGIEALWENAAEVVMRLETKIQNGG